MTVRMSRTRSVTMPLACLLLVVMLRVLLLLLLLLVLSSDTLGLDVVFCCNSSVRTSHRLHDAQASGRSHADSKTQLGMCLW